eukprot:943881-Amorphochlora_amoeboformis.AAC.3
MTHYSTFSFFVSQFPGKWDYNRLCFRYGEFCGVGTILDLFDYDITLINSLTGISNIETARKICV